MKEDASQIGACRIEILRTGEVLGRSVPVRSARKCDGGHEKLP
jgi:hypothetical protein